jgi:broad specificity phosphatase PhoE
MYTGPANIYLSRHCKTAWNLDRRLQGTIDLPLSEVGIKEAKANVAAIRDLGVQCIVCSTARRAYETAQLYGASLELPIHTSPRLRELDHGQWEGRIAKELLLHPDSGYAKWLSDPGCIPIPGGSESVQAAQQRAAEAIRDAALSFRGESVLVIGHKHINALLMCALLNEPLTTFGSHLVEDTLPHVLAADAVERLRSDGEQGARRTSEFIHRGPH